MADIDLNLLPALDALLSEGSVTGAARKLGVSASAMSRTLARLRSVSGDPLLVRAGSGLVPTPRAIAIRQRVRELAREARDVLGPQPGHVDLASLDRTFIVRAGDGFVALFGAALVAAVMQAAPCVQLRFAAKPVKDARLLREGEVDLEIGVLGASAPEVRTRSIFHDRFVGVVRAGHSLLGAPMTPAAYASARHVVVSRHAAAEGPVDQALAELGLARAIVAVVPGFTDALQVARGSDAVALVPGSLLSRGLASAARLSEGLVDFELPVVTPEIVVSAMWHPRFDAEPGHRWMRETVVRVCRQAIDPVPTR